MADKTTATISSIEVIGNRAVADTEFRLERAAVSTTMFIMLPMYGTPSLAGGLKAAERLRCGFMNGGSSTRRGARLTVTGNSV